MSFRMPSSQCLLQEKMKCLRGVKLLAFPGLLTQAACIFLCFGWDVLGSEWWGSQVTHSGPGAFSAPSTKIRPWLLWDEILFLHTVKQSRLLK